MSYACCLNRRAFVQSATAIAALATLPAASRPVKGTIAIDTHAHVFRRDLPMAERRRYAVDYDATPDTYIRMLADNGVHRGVLIQPSFLGFDNSYLLSVLGQFPEQLRGIVSLDRNTSADEMSELALAGVRGIRLNLIGRSDPDLASDTWRRHLGTVARLGWQIEVQCEAGRMPRLLPPLIRSGAPVVIDHFGRPDTKLGLSDPGFLHLLDAARSGRVFVKLSGAYRIGNVLADQAAPRLLSAFGPERLMWGSDWPHTQFETVADARVARTALDRWVPDPTQLNQILDHTPAALFGFVPLRADTAQRRAAQ